MHNRLKLLIIGLDGGDFSTLSKWIDAGCLPNLKKIIDSGVTADLLSTIPPVTAPAWTSFMTGLNPGRHGLFSFFNYKYGFENPELNSLKDIPSPRIWDYLNQGGLKVGVADLPLTYPPCPLDGVLVSNLMTAGRKHAVTYPEDLKEELNQNLSISFDSDILDNLSQTARYLKQLIGSVKEKQKMDAYLIDRYKLDCYITVYSHTDTFQHYFWKYFDKSHPLYDAKKNRKLYPFFNKFFRQIDEAVQRLCQYLDDRSYVIFVSDHGFGSLNRVVNMNRFLSELGYISFKQESRTGKKGLLQNIDARKFLGFLSRMDVFKIKERMNQKLRNKVKLRLEHTFSPQIDYGRSLAFFGHSMDQGIFINKDHPRIKFDPEKFEKIREQLRSSLETLKDPYAGIRIFEAVHFPEDIYTGDKRQDAPDILLSAAPGYFCHSGISSHKIVEDQHSEFASGDHRPKGIFIAKGRNLKKNKSVDEVHIMDILPTALYLCGLPVPKNLDGRIASQIFAKGK